MLAQEAAAALRLDRVLLVPVGESPQKRIEGDPGAGLRLAMARLAAATADGLLEASDVDVGRRGPSFTYRTLEILRDEHPSDRLWFVLGADAAAGLEAWREPGRVTELARLAIAARPGAAIADALAALERLGAGARADMVEIPQMGVSSSMVRERVAAGAPIRYLVPDAVAALIQGRGLYRS